jgi:hypothetical protein
LNGNKKPLRKGLKSRSISESRGGIPNMAGGGDFTEREVRDEDSEDRMRREERSLRVKKKARSRANSDDEVCLFPFAVSFTDPP